MGVAGIHFPQKDEGIFGLVMDYKRLNFMTEIGSYGIPLITNILPDQVQKRVFSVLDLKHGYHQMKLAEQWQDCKTMS